MNKNRREQIYNDLVSKNTEDLLEIWQAGNIAEWEESVFELIKEILSDRLGYVPLRSIDTQVLQILDNAKKYLENKELDKALSECELAIQLNPNSAFAYNQRGEIVDEMGQLDNAIINYQRAIHLDPELIDAWDNMLSVEAEIEEEFQESSTRQRLDQALEYANDGETDKALEECEAIKSSLPNIAIAHNYLGLILQSINQLEPAIDSYQKAVQLNPHFYAARENLANARVRWEEEQYHLFSKSSPIETGEIFLEFDESQIPETNDTIPQWFYMDENAFLLVGWPGHRTRQGRSGYDPLDSEFEFAHMLGVIIRALLDGKCRTKNPIYLFLMICAGFMFCTPLLVLTVVVRPDWNLILIVLFSIIASSPYWMVGTALLANVILSFRPEMSEKY